MFGLTELTVLSEENLSLAIIPTVVLPFAVLGMILTSLATWIAAFFGMELKTEGPKRLLEVILKPKVIIASLLLNALVYSAVIGYRKIRNSSWPNTLIQIRNAFVVGSALSYATPSNSSEAAEADWNKGRISNAKLIWKSKIKGAVFSSPVVTEKSLFIGTRRGFLYELDKENGKILRQFAFGQPVMSKPIIFNNHIYFGEGVHETYNAKLISINLIDGQFKGSLSTEGHIERGPIFAKYKERSFILVPAGKDGIYAIDPTSMEMLWHQKIGHIDGIPFVVENRIYIGTGMEEGDPQTWTKIYSLDLETGKIIHEKEIATSAFGQPFQWKNNICFNIGDVYRSVNYGQIACYDKINFHEVSAVNVGGAIITNAVIDNNFVVVTDIRGGLYKIDLEKSRILHKSLMPIHKYNFSSVEKISKDEIVLTGKEGLYVYSIQDLSLKYVWKVSYENWSGAFDTISQANGLWYWADKEGNVFALEPDFL